MYESKNIYWYCVKAGFGFREADEFFTKRKHAKGKNKETTNSNVLICLYANFVSPTYSLDVSSIYWHNFTGDFRVIAKGREIWSRHCFPQWTVTKCNYLITSLITCLLKLRHEHVPWSYFHALTVSYNFSFIGSVLYVGHSLWDGFNAVA